MDEKAICKGFSERSKLNGYKYLEDNMDFFFEKGILMKSCSNCKFGDLKGKIDVNVEGNDITKGKIGEVEYFLKCNKYSDRKIELSPETASKVSCINYVEKKCRCFNCNAFDHRNCMCMNIKNGIIKDDIFYGKQINSDDSCDLFMENGLC